MRNEKTLYYTLKTGGYDNVKKILLFIIQELVKIMSMEVLNHFLKEIQKYVLNIFKKLLVEICLKWRQSKNMRKITMNV